MPYHGLDPQDIKAKVVKDSSLPAKMTIKKSVLELSNFPLMQSIDVEQATPRPGLLPPKWQSLVIGDLEDV